MRRGGVAGGEASAGPEGEVDQGDQRGHLYERSDDAARGTILGNEFLNEFVAVRPIP